MRRRLTGWTLAALVVVMSLWFASHIPRTIAVFVIAAFIAFGVYPIVQRLERRVPRAYAIAIVYTALIALVIVLALLVVPATLGQIESLGYRSPEYFASVQDAFAKMQAYMREHFGRSYLPSGYNDLEGFIAAKAGDTISNVLGSLSDVLVATLTAGFITVSAIVLSAFFVLRGSHVADSFYDLLPVTRRPMAREIGAELAHVFGGYVAGQTLVCVVTGALVGIGTALLGFKFALLLGIITGLAYAVPFVGMIVAHLIAILLALPQGGGMVLWVSVVLFVIGRLSDNVLVPRVMSKSVGVSPIVVMFAVFAGGELFGLPGMVLGIPVAALLRVAWRFIRPSIAALEAPPGEPATLEVTSLGVPSAPVPIRREG